MKPLLGKNLFTPVLENRQLITRFLFTALFIVLGAWFFRHEQHEIAVIRSVIRNSQTRMIITGIALTVIYIFLQGLMYRMAFRSTGTKISLKSSLILFLKRNFISVFIPAGGVTSLAFFTGSVESETVTKSRIYFASSLYVFTGIATVAMIAIPGIIYALIKGLTGSGEIIALAAMLLVIILVVQLYRSVSSQGRLYRFVVKVIPASSVFLEDLKNNQLSGKFLLLTVLISLIIDVICILQLYVAMLALNIHPEFLFAILGYLITILSVFISPFMRGLGAVEVSLAFILTRFGYTNVEAVAITFVYRFFEFWLPLAAGALSFLYKLNKLLMRIIPALLIFLLGIINILSAVTPAIHERVRLLLDFIPMEAISASNYLVLLSGALLLLTAVFMFKGLKNAWYIAIVLCIVSFTGHLTKAIDYEEATLALIVIIMLIISRKEYFVKGNPRMHVIGIRTGFLSILVVLIYGVTGFYFLDKKDFGIDFNLQQSVRYTLGNFFLTGNDDLIPHTRFAKEFLISMNISGMLALSFLFFTIIRSYTYKAVQDPDDLAKARQLMEKYGKSGLDYFKLYHDKMIFLPEGLDAFIAYRVAGNFAVVLEDPVAADTMQMRKCILLFDRYCNEYGLKSVYYRVPDENLHVYHSIKKKSLFIGQEAVVDLENFSMEGGKYKSLRNAVNKLTGRGFTSTVHHPPLKDGLMQKLKAVSDDWLLSTGRGEIIFSQGMFDWNEIKQQTVITVENAEEFVIAFLNVIPDYAAGEGTYDLVRKTSDAPHGVMEFILVEFFRYLKENSYKTANLGFAPMSGLQSPVSLPERSMKFAYEKIRTFSHYTGMRYFKEKFFPEWKNKYLVYSHDYDLLQIPAVLQKVIKLK